MSNLLIGFFVSLPFVLFGLYLGVKRVMYLILSEPAFLVVVALCQLFIGMATHSIGECITKVPYSVDGVLSYVAIFELLELVFFVLMSGIYSAFLNMANDD